MTKKSVFIVALILTVAVFLGCSTKKNTVATRTFHNVTAKYNILFNGSESFNKGVTKIATTYKDNYTEVLPLFIYGDAAAAKSASSDFDKTIKKSIKLVKKHSITVKPGEKEVTSKKGKSKKVVKAKTPKFKNKKESDFYNRREFCDYVYDAYLYMGKAQFYRQEYPQALKTFDFMIKEYSPDKIVYDANLWMARTYIQQKEYKSAKDIIDLMGSTRKFPYDKKGELSLITADYFMKQNKLSEAAPFIEKALKTPLKRKDKIRYNFILAQIYQRNNDNRKATDLYDLVIRKNPPYEMAFNAKINRAQTYTLGSGGSDIKGQLLKMLKDEKNMEYRDQIYYSLANIEFKQNNIDQAIKYYRMSAMTSVNNNHQKGLSYLALANIYFDRAQYVPAQAYFDSTVSYINHDYTDFDKIALKAKNLTELTKGLTTIQFQDSIQKIAKMPKDKQMALIDGIIEKVKEKEEEAKREAQQELLNRQSNQPHEEYGMGSITPTGKWYFYNPSSIALGQAEFYKKWGKRKLEDDWRRKNKAIVATSDETTATTTKTDSVKTKLTNKMRDYYTRNIPQNDSAIVESNLKISDAYFKVGRVYKDKLNENELAIKYFDELITRFPKGDNKLEAYYNLYQIYRQTGDQAKMELYKSKIITEFPDSRYAKSFTNPNYIQELMANQNRLQDLYENTYKLYQSKQYASVVNNFNEAKTTFPDNKLMPKFMFIKALSVGEMNKPDVTQFKTDLLDIINKYPSADVAKSAKDILAAMRKSPTKIVKDSTYEYDDLPNAEKIYKFDEKALHVFVIVVSSKKLNMEQLKFNVLEFDVDNYSDKTYNLAVNDIDTVKAVTVKPFESKEVAMSYFKKIKTDEKVFKDFKKTDYQYFVISFDNLATLQNDKKIERYIKFFKKYYTKEK